MNDFTPVPASIGGALIGLAASLYFLSHGRPAGISGIYGSALRPDDTRGVRVSFIAGLLFAGLVLGAAFPGAFATRYATSLPVTLAAGLLVGFGTRLGSGCTSGHGVCGLSRWSRRSLVATGTFMAFGFATVFVTHHVLGGTR